MLGNVFYVEEPFWPHDTTLWVKDFHGNFPKFVYWFLITFNLEQYDAATSVPTLNRNNIHGIKVCIPPLPEQQKIASFLSAVDRKIQQLTRKKELLEQYKRGVMQKIFSREIRFKDENGKDYPDWEEKRLGDVCFNIKSGKSKPNENGQYLLYGSTGKIGKCNEYSHEGKYVLVARVGANAGTINLVDDKFGVSDNTLVIESKLNTEIRFIYHTLDMCNLNRLVFGSGQPLITGSQLKSLKIQIAKIAEQKKIASFLTGIEKKIESTQNQLTQTQTFKKGLLQQMFI